MDGCHQAYRGLPTGPDHKHAANVKVVCVCERRVLLWWRSLVLTSYLLFHCYLDSSTVGFYVDDIPHFHSLLLKTLIDTGVQLAGTRGKHSVTIL